MSKLKATKRRVHKSTLVLREGLPEKYRERFYMPTHPNADSYGQILAHRYYAAKALGKPLPEGAQVHHAIGGQPILCQDQTYHYLLHLRQRAYAATGDPTKRKCACCHQWDGVGNLLEVPRYRAGKPYSRRHEHLECRRRADRYRSLMRRLEGERSRECQPA